MDAGRVGGVAPSSGVARAGCGAPVFSTCQDSSEDKYFVTSGHLLWLNFDSCALIGQFNEPGHE